MGTCAQRRDAEFYEWREFLPTTLSFESKAIAKCMNAYPYVSIGPVAVAVLHESSCYSFFSDGLVYVMTFDEFAHLILEYEYARYAFQHFKTGSKKEAAPLAVPDYKLVIMF